MRSKLIMFSLMAAGALPAWADDSRLLTTVTLQDLQTLLVEE